MIFKIFKCLFSDTGFFVMCVLLTFLFILFHSVEDNGVIYYIKCTDAHHCKVVKQEYNDEDF